MRSAGASADGITERLGRHPSTVYRELGRCGGVEGVYDAQAAHADARLRAQRPRAAKLEADPTLAGEVNTRLDLCWSPHAITAALARQPEHLVRTLTWDQGRELARWADIETALSVGCADDG